MLRVDENLTIGDGTGMANEKEPVPGSRGERVDQIRKALGKSREELADVLAAKARELHVTSGGKWTPTRVSKLILGRQPISLDDAAVVVAVDPDEDAPRWDWFVFGEELRIGDLAPDPTREVRATAAEGAAKPAKPRKRATGHGG